jgi:nucleolar MIF4G domain-containing protein 1
MIDCIYNIKNNKYRQEEQSLMVRLKKLVQTMIQKRCGMKKDPLRVPFEDYLHVTQCGRWWLVGSAWMPHESIGLAPKAATVATATFSASETNLIETDPNMEKKMMAITQLLHFNTEVRRTIFAIMVSSEDYLDAFEKLLRFNTQEKQDRETVRVLVQCCGHEKLFNKFYAYLAEKLCQHEHGYKVTFQFCFWDFWKTIEHASVRKIAHLAKLLVHLLLTEALSMSIIKAIDFMELKSRGILFFQLVFSDILTVDSEASMIRAFQSIVVIKEVTSLRQGIIFFFHNYMKSLDFMKTDRHLLERRWYIVKRWLSQSSSF